MRPTPTRDKTITFKPPENWDTEALGPCGDLEVRVDIVGDGGVLELVSTWKPSAFELQKLNEGGVVEIALCQTTQPPMRAYVVNPIQEPAPKPEVPHITINENAHGDDSHGGPEEDQYGYGGRGVSGG